MGSILFPEGDSTWIPEPLLKNSASCPQPPNEEEMNVPQDANQNGKCSDREGPAGWHCLIN